jgi:hypothetical protein
LLVTIGDGDAGDDQKLAEHCAVDQGPLSPITQIGYPFDARA